MSKIREEFAVHLLNEEGLTGARKLGEILTETLDRIEAINKQPCREMSLVKTHLQDAGFWAKRALAVNPEMQIKQPDPISEDRNPEDPT
jgi:hypothetical protein